MSQPKKPRVEVSSNPAVWKQWLDELNEASEEEAIDPDESDSGESDHLSISNHYSESEQSDGEETEYQGESQDLFFLGKDKTTKWLKEVPKKNVRTRKENIITHLPGPKAVASKITQEDKLLDLFLDSNVYKIIVDCTNIYINIVKNKFQRERDARTTDETEIRALFGLLYLIGTYKSSRTNVHKLWDNSRGNGLESCYLSMSEKRFRFLLRCLRFDDVRNRESRRQIDKLSAIRNIFEIIKNNYSKHFIPSEYVTVDEQLLAFRGKCPFRQYNPRKPAKYGIKTFALVDAKMAYTMNLETYVGTQPEGPFRQSNSPMDVVMRLAEPVKGSNRNLTADNWFSSVPLGKKLLEEMKLTFVGTLRKNKREIPVEFLPNKTRAEHSSLFGFQQDATLVSYCTKKRQAVLLLSTLHHDNTIDEDTGDLHKPEIVTFYNMTKIGVDLVDQLIQNYNVARNTRRWPMVVFFNLLNISAINALCIFKYNLKKKVSRDSYLQGLAWEMIKPQIQIRSGVLQLPIELRRRACVLLGVDEKQPGSTGREGARGRCYDCGRMRDRTTRKWCEKCQKWMCNEHLKNVCKNCYIASV